jgi:threonine/homoserine/homoserine lactone efflux protein
VIAREAITTFVAVSVVVTVTPGPDTVLVLRNVLTRGLRAAVATAAGAATGSMSWGVLTAFGVSAIVQRSAVALDVLRYFGVAYIAYLGVRTILDRDDPEPDPRDAVVDGHRPAVGTQFRHGLLSDLLSPKACLFFLAILPQFVPAGWAPLPSMLLLAAIDAVLVLGWLGVLAFLAHRALDWMRRPLVRAVLRWGCGVALSALAVEIAIGDVE